MSVNLKEEYRELCLGGCGNSALPSSEAVATLAAAQGMSKLEMALELGLTVNEGSLEAATELFWRLTGTSPKDALRQAIERYLESEAVR